MKVRGCRDYLPELATAYQRVTDTFSALAQKWGYSKVILPTLQEEKLFKRSLGENSDIVMKEMFSLKGKDVVLRPEGTAGAMRAYTEGKQLWYYEGSMFRWQRPQQGRYRQFKQFGVENIGSLKSAYIDSDIISLAYYCLKQLGIQSKLQINTIGTSEQRKKYTQILSSFFNENFDQLSSLSRQRLQRGNPLRIFDSKEPQDFQIKLKAPKITDYICSDYFTTLQSSLIELKIPFEINPYLVRGLDYYSDTCFEFTYGGQALIGGGRYDYLASLIGKNHTPAVGWAAGLDRILEFIPEVQFEPSIGIISVGQYFNQSLKLALSLRENGLKTLVYPGTLKHQLSYMNAKQTSFVIFIGENQIETNVFTVKNYRTGEQCFIPRESIINFLVNK